MTAAELTALADDLEAIERRCRQLRLDFDPPPPAPADRETRNAELGTGGQPPAGGAP